MGELRVIGRVSTVAVGDAVEGDLRITWRKNNLEETALAEKTFQEYINRGWIAVGEASGKKMQIFKFNPDLERIVLAPLMVGG